jgi:hypothetical protein
MSSSRRPRNASRRSRATGAQTLPQFSQSNARRTGFSHLEEDHNAQTVNAPSSAIETCDGHSSMHGDNRIAYRRAAGSMLRLSRRTECAALCHD